MQKLYVTLLTISSAFFANGGATGIANAADKLTPPATIGIFSSGTTAGNSATAIMCSVAKWLFTAAIIFSIVLAIVTGIQYMTSGGNPEKTKSAHNKLLYLAIGVAVAILARTIPVLVATVLQAPGAEGLGAVCS
jgi:hypothetical protein